MFLKLEDYMLPCLNKNFLGFDCLGCGMQRSIIYLLQGDFINAFKMYPAIYTLLFFFGFIIVNFFYKFKKAQKIVRYLVLINLLIIIGSYLIKMIF